MSNRDALRKLSKKLPASPEVEAIIDNLNEGSDLSVAVTATAIVEASLEKLLNSKFHSKKRSLLGQLFNNRGPLSDFSSKILIAEAFGIITPVMAHDLNIMRTVRNTFAHAKMPLTFEHDLISRELESFRMRTAAERETAKKYPKELKSMEAGHKAWFLLITRFLLIMFDSFESFPGTANEAIAHALAERL